MSRIFIMPVTGKYEGQLLVFDHVESMTHISTSKIPSHPVESLNRSSADHRYRDGVKIQIVGNVSDQWTSTAVTVPQPFFKTLNYIRQGILRDKVREDLGPDSSTTKLVNKILDKEPVTLQEELSVPITETFWVREAKRILNQEKDTLLLANDKELFLENQASNGATLGTQINTRAQAHEMLTYLDENSDLMTVFSLYDTYENMVISNFSNPLRNGPDRGAYWVSLTLDEQLVSTTVRNPLNISPRDSEEVNEINDKGKQVAESIQPGDLEYKVASSLWDQELANRPEIVKLVTDTYKERAIITAAQEYAAIGDRSRAAQSAARRSIIGSQLVLKQTGKALE